MCGECMEGDAINLLEIEAGGKEYTPENPLICFYLQETADLLKGVRRFASIADIGKRLASAFKDDVANIILCRLLETIIKSGFGSPAYQGLLKNKMVRDAIRHGCAHKVQERIKGLGLSFITGDMLELYNASTFINRGGWIGIENREELSAAALQSLKYIEAWLKKHRDRRSDTTLPETDENEYNKFRLLFRIFYMGILFAPNVEETWKSLYCISKHGSIYAGFDGLDLWLRRKAFEQLVLDSPHFSLVPYDPKIPPILYLYVAIKLRISKEEKERLAESMERIIKGNIFVDSIDIEKIADMLREA